MLKILFNRNLFQSWGLLAFRLHVEFPSLILTHGYRLGVSQKMKRCTGYSTNYILKFSKRGITACLCVMHILHDYSFFKARIPWTLLPCRNYYPHSKQH